MQAALCPNQMKGKRTVKRLLSCLLVLALAAALCTMVFAAGGKAYYVSSSGSDDNAGTEAAPFATLAKAVDAAEDGSTIYVMSNLTMTKCARFYDKSLTITSLGDTVFTIVRSDSFETISDTARSWYNPAMIEVQTTEKGAGAGLTLTNITLDDNHIHTGKVFAQAISGEGKDNNTDYVQDAMIASNAIYPTTITLGDGATLQNFGGMSAVRVTNVAKLVMKSGSVIKDTNTHTTRTRGTAAGEVGPAGAVWIQGASFEMEAGAEITELDGRAVYVDGGSATIGGTISGIYANDKMWQGKSGVAIHLRNKATGTLLQGGVIEGISGKDASAISVTTGTLNCNKASEIRNCNSIGIYSVDCDETWNSGKNIVNFNGEIYGTQNNKNPFQIACTNITIGEKAEIHDNTANYGALYLQRNLTADIYGKIYNNTASGRGGGIGTAGHGFVEINLYDGAEIKNNTAGSTGGGISLKNAKFTMYGGEISGNHSTGNNGGGIFLYENVVADLSGGTITGNTDKNGSNDIAITSKCYATGTNNYLAISDDITIGNKAVYFEKDSKTITPASTAFDIKLGNAGTSAIADLKTASNAKGWSDPLATFWAQRDGAATLTVGGLTTGALPVYVLTLPVDDSGQPATSADVKCYAATKTADGVQFTIPEEDLAGNGCAVALVQPTEYYGDLVITADKATLLYDEDAETYTVTYTETFTLSENLKSQLKESVVNMGEVKITLLPDLRLPMDCSTVYTFESNIFKCETFSGSTGGGENSFTANCVPKDGWEAHLDESTVLTVTAVLAKTDFEAGDVLATTGEVVINPAYDLILGGGAGANTDQFPEVAPLTNVYIPGNVCTTLMLAQDDEGGEDKPEQPIGGFFFPVGDEHIAYVSGYPDGTVRPEANVTRAESAAMLYRLMPRGYFASGAQTPADVSVNDWYYSIVSQMIGSGYLAGYADGSFRGDNNVTRAEFVTMLVRLSGVYGGSCNFTDVSPNHWAYDAIRTAAANGWIAGYEDGSFRPDRAITRAEAMTIINRAFDRGVDESSWLGDYIGWPDNHRDAWYYYEVIEATNAHYYTGSRPSEDWVG